MRNSTGSTGSAGNIGAAVGSVGADGELSESALQRVRHLQRALRALRLSGRRLVERNGQWEVRADGRRRPVVSLPPDDVGLLLEEEKIVAAAGGGYVLTASAVEEVTAAEPEESPRAGPWIYMLAGKRRPGAYGAGFAGLALRAQNGEGPLTLRQATAGLKLVADAEQAGRDPTLTMNWDAVPSDRKRRTAGSGGASRGARAAQQRIRHVRDALGEGELPFLWSACVEQVSLGSLARRYRVPRRAVVGALAAALEKLADAYDGNASDRQRAAGNAGSPGSPGSTKRRRGG